MLQCYDLCSETVLCVFPGICIAVPYQLSDFFLLLCYITTDSLSNILCSILSVTSYWYRLMTTDRIIVTSGIKLATMYDPAIDEMNVYRTIWVFFIFYATELLLIILLESLKCACTHTCTHVVSRARLIFSFLWVVWLARLAHTHCTMGSVNHVIIQILSIL